MRSLRMREFAAGAGAPAAVVEAATSVRSASSRGSSSCFTIRPCGSADELGDVRGQLRKREHQRGFINSILDVRDRQLYPRDLLVAWVPARRGGQRPAGVVRRSLKFDKAAGRSSLHVDFVWVAPEFRGQQIGRALLVESLQFGKPKDVRLEVAGSVSNIVAIRLYESLGFRWTDASHAEMRCAAEHARAAAEAYEREAPSRPAGRPGGPPSSAASAATTAVAAAWATSDIASIADVVSPFPSRSPSRATLVEDAGEQPGQGGGDR